MSKVFVLGLDGGTWQVFEPLIAEGIMPNLAKLVAEGAAGDLESTIPPQTAPACTSIQTGVNPGKHGIYDFRGYAPGTYETFFANRMSIRTKTLWEIASANGRTVIAINVPMTYPPMEVNGVIIGGILSPTRSKFTYPDGLQAEIIEHTGDYVIFEVPMFFSKRGVKVLVKRLTYIERKRLEAALYLMDRYDWDLFMLYNQSLDGLQHRLWPFIERTASNSEDELRATILEFYRFIDNAIGTILHRIDSNTTLIVLSDHGFGHLQKRINLNTWLYKQGYVDLTKSPLQFIVSSMINLLRRYDRYGIRFRIGSRQRRATLVNMVNVRRDWSKTRAFVTTGATYGHIYLNCRGREKQGIIEFGGEYERIRNDIVEELRELVDPETGKPVVREVHKREDIYWGRYLEIAPDLIVEPHEGYEFTSVMDETFLFKEGTAMGGYVGQHRRNGVVLLWGEGISPSRLSSAKVVDLAPTVLYLLGLPIPRGMDGDVLREVFVNGRDITFTDETIYKYPGKDPGYSSENGREIHRRLKGLGYLD